VFPQKVKNRVTELPHAQHYQSYICTPKKWKLAPKQKLCVHFTGVKVMKMRDSLKKESRKRKLDLHGKRPFLPGAGGSKWKVA
jgi:hypothetical protein